MSHRQPSNISPHNPHNSVLPRTYYRNVIDNRDRFQNDANKPDVAAASELIDRFRPLYQLAYAFRSSTPTGNGQIPGSAKSLSEDELLIFQLSRSDSASQGVRNPDEVRNEYDGLQKTGMLPWERRVVDLLEAQLGEPVPLPFAQEPVDVNKSLGPSERFRLLEEYFQTQPSDLASKTRAAIPFVRRVIDWRGRQSFNACQALHFLDRYLRGLSPVDLKKMEQRFHVAALPQYDALAHVGERSSRIAICVASVEPVKPKSWIFRLDLVQAALVARKYDAFLAAQKTATQKAEKRPSKSLLLKHYSQIIR